MRANWIAGTSVTGGTGALSLTRLTGLPWYTDAWGTSGNVPAEYEIREFTDYTHTTLLREESGVSTINLATGQLTRTNVEMTWDGTTYKFGANATPLNFGQNPQNIVIVCGSSVMSSLDNWPCSNQQGGFAGGLYIPNTEANMNNTGTSGVAIFFPCRIVGRLPLISSVAIDVTVAAATSTVSGLFFGLYRQSASGAGGGTSIGSLYADFGNGAAISTLAATGVKTGTLTTPVPNLDGVYWGCLLFTYNQAADAPQIRGMYALDQMGGPSGGAGFHLNTITQQSGLSALPATPTASSSLGSLTPLVVFN